MATTFREIDPAFLQRLGAVVTRWALVEEYEEKFLAYLVKGSPAYVSVITTPSSGGAIAGWIRTLTELRFADDEARGKIIEFLDDIDRVRGDRNTLVHGLWSAEEGIPESVIVQTRQWTRPVVLHSKVLTLTDLDEVVGDVSALVAGYVRLADRLGF